MTAIQFPTAWLRRVADFAALAAVLALAACGGGSGAPNNPFAPVPLPPAALTITPQSPTLYSQVATTLTITGGVAPYQAFSNNTAILPVVQSLPGNTVTLLAASVSSLTLVAVTIRDAAGTEATTIVTILPGPATPPPALVVLPSPVDVFAGTAAQLTISGGVAPYTAFSSNSAVLPVVQTVAGSIVNLLANDVAANTVVVVTIRDAVGQTSPVTVTVHPKVVIPPSPLVVLPNNVVMSKAVPVTITISGGLAPYQAYSSNPAVIPVNQSVAGNSIVLTAGAVAADTNVAITVQDSAGQTANVAVLVQPQPSTPPPTLAVLPSTATIFSNVAASVSVTGGVPPYQAFSSNPTILPVTQAVAGSTIPLLATNVSANTTVTLTVQDSNTPNPATATATITVSPAALLNNLTIRPNFADCSNNSFFPNAICSGQTGTATVTLLLPGGGPAPGRQVRFDVVQGPYGIATTASPTPQPSQTVTSDQSGNASVIISANVDAPTQPSLIRATDIASGQQLTGQFLIVQKTDGSTILTVVPAEATLNAPYNDACTQGFRADYFIFGGTPPYTVTQTFPELSVLVGSPVQNEGGFFEVRSNGGCVNPQTLTIQDATGRITTARFFNLIGTAARPPEGPPALVVTPSAIPSSSNQQVSCTVNDTYRFVVSGGTAPYNAYQNPQNNAALNPNVRLTTSGGSQTAFAVTIPSSGLFFDVVFTDTVSGTIVFNIVDASNPQKSTTARIRCQ